MNNQRLERSGEPLPPWRELFFRADARLQEAKTLGPNSKQGAESAWQAEEFRREALTEFKKSGGDHRQLLEATKLYSERAGEIRRPATAANSLFESSSDLQHACTIVTPRERYEFLKLRGLALLGEGDFEGALNQLQTAKGNTRDKCERMEIDGYRVIAYTGLGELDQARQEMGALWQFLPTLKDSDRVKVGAVMLEATRELYGAGAPYTLEPFCMAVAECAESDPKLYWQANFLRARAMEREGLTAEAFNHLRDLHLSVDDPSNPYFLESLSQAVSCSIRIGEPAFGLRLLRAAERKYPDETSKPLILGILEGELFLATGDLHRARQAAVAVDSMNNTSFRRLSPIEEVRNHRVHGMASLEHNMSKAIEHFITAQRIVVSEHDPELSASLMLGEAYAHFKARNLDRAIEVLDRLEAATHPLPSRARSIYYPLSLILRAEIMPSISDSEFQLKEKKQERVEAILEEAVGEFNQLRQEPKAVAGGAQAILMVALHFERLNRVGDAVPYLLEAVDRLDQNQQIHNELYVRLLDKLRKFGVGRVDGIDLRELSRKRDSALELINKRQWAGTTTRQPLGYIS